MDREVVNNTGSKPSGNPEHAPGKIASSLDPTAVVPRENFKNLVICAREPALVMPLARDETTNRISQASQVSDKNECGMLSEIDLYIPHFMGITRLT